MTKTQKYTISLNEENEFGEIAIATKIADSFNEASEIANQIAKDPRGTIEQTIAASRQRIRFSSITITFENKALAIEEGAKPNRIKPIQKTMGEPITYMTKTHASRRMPIPA